METEPSPAVYEVTSIGSERYTVETWLEVAGIRLRYDKSCVLATTYNIYICTVFCINDFLNEYYQIIIKVAQLGQHKQRLNDLRTQLG